MEKIYNIGIVKIPEATYNIYQTCVTVQSRPGGIEEVIKWLPFDRISDRDWIEYHYFIDKDGDLSRKRKGK